MWVPIWLILWPNTLLCPVQKFMLKCKTFFCSSLSYIQPFFKQLVAYWSEMDRGTPCRPYYTSMPCFPNRAALLSSESFLEEVLPRLQWSDTWIRATSFETTVYSTIVWFWNIKSFFEKLSAPLYIRMFTLRYTS